MPKKITVGYAVYFEDSPNPRNCETNPELQKPWGKIPALHSKKNKTDKYPYCFWTMKDFMDVCQHGKDLDKAYTELIEFTEEEEEPDCKTQ